MSRRGSGAQSRSATLAAKQAGKEAIKRSDAIGAYRTYWALLDRDDPSMVLRQEDGRWRWLTATAFSAVLAVGIGVQPDDRVSLFNPFWHTLIWGTLLAGAALHVFDLRAGPQALADWIDGDGIPLPLGAEDATYRSREPAYRTANTLVTMLFGLAFAPVFGIVDGLFGMEDGSLGFAAPWLGLGPDVPLWTSLATGDFLVKFLAALLLLAFQFPPGTAQLVLLGAGMAMVAGTTGPAGTSAPNSSSWSRRIRASSSASFPRANASGSGWPTMSRPTPATCAT